MAVIFFGQIKIKQVILDKDLTNIIPTKFVTNRLVDLEMIKNIREISIITKDGRTRSDGNSSDDHLCQVNKQKYTK